MRTRIFDLAGVSVFAAAGEGDVPRHGPIFSALGKLAFGFYDKPNIPLKADAVGKLAAYTQHWESPEKGIENLLIKQLSIAVIKRFLDEVTVRSDYPSDAGAYNPGAADAEITALAAKVLKARKGDAHGYAAILISHCHSAAELPATIRTILETIHAALTSVPEDIAVAPADDLADLPG